MDWICALVKADVWLDARAPRRPAPRPAKDWALSAARSVDSMAALCDADRPAA